MVAHFHIIVLTETICNCNNVLVNVEFKQNEYILEVFIIGSLLKKYVF